MIRVLFVCLGNICRSPMADGIFLHLVREAGLADEFQVDSAGTGHWHLGERPHEGTRRVLNQAGIQYDGRARLFTQDDLRTFDYIIPMDRANLRDIQTVGDTKAELALLLSYSPDCGMAEVPDPYYTGKFEEVFDLVSQGCEGLFAAIRRDRHL